MCEARCPEKSGSLLFLLVPHGGERTHEPARHFVQCPHERCDRRLQDRKSTRLNSSHQIISYAVFCLKKKKRPTGTTLQWEGRTIFDRGAAVFRPVWGSIANPSTTKA